MDTKVMEINETIPETLKALADAVGVALRERAGDAGLKTYEGLNNDDAAVVKMS
jgi:hypothetical protein